MAKSLFIVLFSLSGLTASTQALDSLAYYDLVDEYEKMARVVQNQRDLTPRLYYYLARSFNQFDNELALHKMDSLISINEVEVGSKWSDRLLAVRIAQMRKVGLFKETVDEGKALISQLKDSLSLFDVSHNISISFRRLDQYDSAMRWGLSLLTMVEYLGDPLRKHRALQNLANLHDALRDYQQTINLERQLIVLADSLQNVDLRILDRTNIGSSYLNLQLPDSAKWYFDQALSIAKATGRLKRVPLILYNMGSLEYRGDRYQEAIRLLQECLQVAESQPTILVRSHYLLALCYLELRSFESLKTEIAKGLLQADRYGLRRDKAYFMQLKADVLQNEGDYDEAINTLKQLQLLEDSILNEDRIRAIEEMETKYETEKKEQQIANLEQKAEIAALRIRQQRGFLIGGALLLLFVVVLGVAFYRNRTLRLAQQRLLVEHQLFRSQMNPHFLFNALASIHSFIFQGSKHEAAEYLSVFSELTRNILDYTGREWISLQQELETLEKYLKVQQMRFSELRYEFKVDDLEASIVQFPPLLLQPFIENSIEHGFKGSNGGKIDIELTTDGNLLDIRIYDDGKGLTTIPGQKDHESKAIKMAFDRLKLLYGEKSKGGLEIKKRPDATGVEVHLRLPYIELL